MTVQTIMGQTGVRRQYGIRPDPGESGIVAMLRIVSGRTRTEVFVRHLATLSMAAVAALVLAGCGGNDLPASGDVLVDPGPAADLGPADPGVADPGDLDPGAPEDPGPLDPGAHDTDAADDADASQEAPAFRKGPLLQQVTNESVRILVESPVAPGQAVATYGRFETPDIEEGTATFTVRNLEFSLMPALATWIATTTLEGLDPETRYWYCVDIGIEPACGSFWTAPDPASTTAFDFLAFGDTRTNHDDHRKVIRTILEDDPLPRFMLHTGDFGEVGGNLDDWQAFFEIEGPLMAHAPFYGVPGNHELIAFGGGDYFNAFLDQPRDGMTFSFVYGNAAIIAINTEDDVTQGPELVWLTQELERLSNAGFHLFVMAHNPIYTFSNHLPYSGGAEILHPLFRDAGVLGVFQGHNHCYEHFLVEGVHYFTLGGGGAPLYGTDSNLVAEMAHLRVFAQKVHHHAMISVLGGTLTMEVFDSNDGSVIEAITLRE